MYLILLKDYWGSSVRATDLGLVLLHGLRFDTLWASIWLAVPLVFITVPEGFVAFSDKTQCHFHSFRKHWAGLFTFVTASVCMISVEYYKEYGDFFNEFLFGVVYDDQGAIVKTILAEYSPFKNLLIISVFVLLYYKGFCRLFKIDAPVHTVGNPRIDRGAYKIGITVLLLVLLVGAYRGGYGRRPVQLKDAAVTQDSFLNKAVVSPLSALKYAIKEHNKVNHGIEGFQAYSDVPIQALAKMHFNTADDWESLDEYMKVFAKGIYTKPPRHVFVIVIESYDAWSLNTAYEQLELNPELKQLAQKGIYLKAFLPGSTGTMTSLNTLATGLPDAGVFTNYQKNSAKAYPTSPALQFKRLGYKTNFFYGGYLSWQRIEDFMKAQGFEYVYGAPHISTWGTTTEWGVDDASLYQFIAKTITDETPTFTMIMTTSNHPPFTIDLKKEGFDEKAMQEKLKAFPNSPATAKHLGHLWYADKTMGEFVKKIENKLPGTLFAITGDHYARRHVQVRPGLFESNAVPFVLYGRGITDGLIFPQGMAGSHIDIGVTLIEMAAPKGFQYHALGKNLLASCDGTVGIGHGVAISSDHIYPIGSPDSCEVIPNQVSCMPMEARRVHEQYHQAMGIAWWRIIKGEKCHNSLEMSSISTQ